jgi:hypothetical protein
MDGYYILSIIFACLMALITLYLTILYIKSEAFHTYSCYNIILMSIVILCDSLLQLIPKSFGTDGEYEGWEYIKDLVTIFFDKMILAVLLMQVIVLYMGIIHSKYYFEHEKIIFIVGTIVCAIISGVLAAIYSSIRWVHNKEGIYIYDEDEENDSKDTEVGKRTITRKVLETIFCVVLFIANVFCLVVVMVHISKKNKEAKAGIIEDLGYERQLIRFLFIFFINILALVVSGVIMNFKLLKKVDEIIYLVVCFAIDLCYSINKTVLVETKKLFCKQAQFNEEGEQVQLKKMSTFGEEETPADDDE